MRFALLVCVDETDPSNQDAAHLALYGEFFDVMQQRDVLQSGERLQSTGTATTVRLRDGELLTANGPIAETKVQIGGLFIVDCLDLDEAIEIASKIPAVPNGGTIEVRPIWEM